MQAHFRSTRGQGAEDRECPLLELRRVDSQEQDKKELSVSFRTQSPGFLALCPGREKNGRQRPQKAVRAGLASPGCMSLGLSGDEHRRVRVLQGTHL